MLGRFLAYIRDSIRGAVRDGFKEGFEEAGLITVEAPGGKLAVELVPIEETAKEKKRRGNDVEAIARRLRTAVHANGR